MLVNLGGVRESSPLSLWAGRKSGVYYLPNMAATAGRCQAHMGKHHSIGAVNTHDERGEGDRGADGLIGQNAGK